MNEQDKQAYMDYLKSPKPLLSETPREQLLWQAALEYARGQQEQVACLAIHPIQPLKTDKEGVVRFKENSIVRFLSEGKLNELAVMGFHREDWVQLAQLIGYSLSGWGTLSYVSDEDWERATQTNPAQPVQPAVAQGEPIFWYRPRTDGGYEGPIHNSAIEEVRKRSGAWFGLYAQAPAGAINEQLLEAAKRAINYSKNVGMAEGVSFDDDHDLPFIEAAIAAAEAQPVQPAVNDQMLEALKGVVQLANEAFNHWDNDRDAKVGKILAAMAGWSSNYHEDANKLHDAIAAAEANYKE